MPTERPIVPWSDEGWVEQRAKVRRSPCCKDAIFTGLADGVLSGSCARCSQYVVRVNPRTGKQEVPAGDLRPAPPEGPMSDSVSVAVGGTVPLSDNCASCGSPMLYRIESDDFAEYVVAMFCQKLGCPMWLREIAR